VSRYHTLTPWDKAIEIVHQLASEMQISVITLPTREAWGNISAEEVYAKRSIPHFIASAVDGYAVKASDTRGAHTSNPIKIPSGKTKYVNTGDPIDFPHFDAVIMWEDVVVEEDGIVIRKSIKPGEGLRIIGEDAIKGELIIPRKTYLTPEHIALARAAGVREISVFSKTRVAIIPTGEEMTPPESDLLPGQLPETSSLMVAQHISKLGGDVVWTSKPVPNDTRKMSEALMKGIDIADIVLFIGGSSRGKHDLVADVISEAGNILVRGLRVRPSKPTIIGKVKGKPVIGLPGFPAATYYIVTNLLPILINPYKPKDMPDSRKETVILSTAVPSRGGVAEFVRMAAGLSRDGKIHGVPLPRGSSRLNSLAQANGHLFIPAESEGYRKNTEVDMIFTRKHVPLLMMASDDIALRLLLSMLREHEIYISLAKKGSLGSISAWNEKRVYMAGAHMLHPETGTYNLPYITDDAIVITLAERQQGFFTRPQGPQITSLIQLAEENLKFVNREKGSGTRMLLDYLLQKEGIEPHQINGYFFEQFSHMAVALAVKIGLADIGFGIKAAADALELNFIPIHSETYHLILPSDAHNLAEKISQVLKSKVWKTNIEKLGGYDTTNSGEVTIHNVR